MNYEEELENIKGIGQKTASDIKQVYPTRDLLVSAVGASTELPFDSDVVTLLEKHFKEKKSPEPKTGVLVKSTVGEITLFRTANPKFRVRIGKTPVKVPKRVAEYLVNDGTGRIIKA